MAKHFGSMNSLDLPMHSFSNKEKVFKQRKLPDIHINRFPRLKQTIELRKEWEYGPLPENKTKTLEDNIKHYDRCFKDGKLSDRSAKALGFKLNIR